MRRAIWRWWRGFVPGQDNDNGFAYSGDMSTLRISTERSELDLTMVHRFLSTSTKWAAGIPRGVFERSIRNSLCFGAYLGARQVGFARVISDYATFAYLVDVFVLPEYRGKGYGQAMMAAVMAHPELQGLRRFSLATSSAHRLYARFGFTSPLKPDTLMERLTPDVYKNT